MRWMLLSLIGVALLAMSCHAQTPKDVPESARREILRRGNQVEMTGTIQADGGLMAAAFAPPADDSHKWFVTLVGKPGDSAFEAMRAMIQSNRDEHLLAWIDAGNSSHSTTHYQVRSIDDQTQKDWLAGVKPAIEQYGLPMVVLQPPRTGQFGPPSNIVKGIHGRHTAKELADLLREGVITYVKTLEQPLQAGFRNDQRGSNVPPPFNVAPMPPAQPPFQPNQPNQNQLPFDWPASAPKALTISEIQAACPLAPAEFLISTLNTKDTDLELVKLKWLLYQKENPNPETVSVNPSSCPTLQTGSPGLTGWMPMLLIGLAALVCITVTWTIVSGRKSAAGIADLTAIVRSQSELTAKQIQSLFDQTNSISLPSVKSGGTSAKGAAKNG